jgi:hypothetical protein
VRRAICRQKIVRMKHHISLRRNFFFDSRLARRLATLPARSAMKDK